MWDIGVVSLLSVVAVLVTLEDCVHPISESIQCEAWLKWETCKFSINWGTE